MSDELTYLRWAYANLNRFVSDTENVDRLVDRKALNAAYAAETGNKPPADYAIG